MQLSRKDSKESKDSGSGKNKTEKTPSNASNGVAPTPPPNSAKPQFQTSSAPSLNISFGGNSHSNAPNTSGSSNSPYGTRSSTQAGSGQAPSTPDRRFSQPDRSSPAPPIVVVSQDAHADANARGGHAGQERTSLGDVPRAGTLNRLRQTPKDTIPIIGKPPRKQRSSRFIPSEKVEIERLPPFSGMCCRVYQRHFVTYCLAETPPQERPELFVKKLHQCKVIFDFNDASSELKGKQIKAQTLTEMLEYITTQRNVITDNIYPEVVNMVSD